jgi:3,4-dihydroxy 2-butanone 4-phosphate synthase/GTP cyclohydrolase II
MVILVDEEDRENEGDLVLAADFVTPEAINFMARYGRGLICLTLTEQRCEQLNLSMMTTRNGTSYGTNFTVSIEAAEGVTTGISAADRSRTIEVAVARHAKPNDIVQPGHIFPLRAQRGGVLMRAGHTEAGCDLASLAGLEPASVICEILKDDGSMARLPDLIAFGQKHGLKIGTISDLIAYRRRHDNLIKERAAKQVTSVHGGEWLMRVFADTAQGDDHIVLTKGDLSGDAPVLVRMHQLNPLEDVLGIGDAHVGDLQGAMQVIAAEGRGAVVLLRDTTMKLPLEGEVSPQTLRIYGLGAQILASLGLTQITLVSNSAAPRVVGLDAYGLTITGTRRIKD